MLSIDPKKKYGLLISKKDKLGNKSFVPKPSVFQSDSDDDEYNNVDGKKAVNRTIIQESTKIKLKKQTQLEIEAALKQDPTIYEYDEIYEKVHQVKETKEERKKVVKTSRYIEQLKKATNKRKIENERRTERQVQKERDQEDGEFAGKEEFVTESYKKRMLERQLEDEKDRQQDAMEEILDVKKQSNLNGFYRGLYSQTLKNQENPKITLESDTVKEDTACTSSTDNKDTHRSSSKERSTSKRSSKERPHRRNNDNSHSRGRSSERSNVRSRSKDRKRIYKSPNRISSRAPHEHKSTNANNNKIASTKKIINDSETKKDSKTIEPILKCGVKRNLDTSSAKERYLARKASMNVTTYKEKD